MARCSIAIARAALLVVALANMKTLRRIESRAHRPVQASSIRYSRAPAILNDLRPLPRNFRLFESTAPKPALLIYERGPLPALVLPGLRLDKPAKQELADLQQAHQLVKSLIPALKKTHYDHASNRHLHQGKIVEFETAFRHDDYDDILTRGLKLSNAENSAQPPPSMSIEASEQTKRERANALQRASAPPNSKSSPEKFVDDTKSIVERSDDAIKIDPVHALLQDIQFDIRTFRQRINTSKAKSGAKTGIDSVQHERSDSLERSDSIGALKLTQADDSMHVNDNTPRNIYRILPKGYADAEQQQDSNEKLNSMARKVLLSQANVKPVVESKQSSSLSSELHEAIQHHGIDLSEHSLKQIDNYMRATNVTLGPPEAKRDLKQNFMHFG